MRELEHYRLSVRFWRDEGGVELYDLANQMEFVQENPERVLPFQLSERWRAFPEEGVAA